jgi:hypothetical protein
LSVFSSGFGLTTTDSLPDVIDSDDLAARISELASWLCHATPI